MSITRRCGYGLAFAIGSTVLLPVYAATDTSSKIEEQQLTEDFSPQAQYRLATREAHAAYQDALANCRKQKGTERNNCVKEARANLQGDLAEAKKNRSVGQ